MTDRGLVSANRLADSHEASRGRTLTYTGKTSDGAIANVTVIGTVGNTLFKQSDTAGRLRMHHGDRDYLIRAASIILGGETRVPEPGDRITDDTETYEVTSPGGEPCYRKSDHYGIRLRIHCKQIG